MIKPINPDLANPFRNADGEAAYKAIMSFLRKHKLLHTGGCKAFYASEKWGTMGGAGWRSVLIVVHDGGDLAAAFNWAYESPLYGKMVQHLDKAGFYPESLNSCSTAIYTK